MKDFFSNWRRSRPSERRSSPDDDPELLVAKADGARDAGRPGEAAALYAAVLVHAPKRSDLRVQLANMLKDAGNANGAIEQYRAALTGVPRNGDTWLQLGRALRQAGRRVESIEAFRHARELDGRLSGAALELLRERAISSHDPAYAEAPALERLGSLQAARQVLSALRDDIDEALARLPDLEMWAAVPPDHYGLLRAGLDLPEPPQLSGAAAVTIDIAIDGDTGDPAALHALLGSLPQQDLPAWRLSVAVTRPALRDAVARAAIRDPRIRLDDGAEPDPTAWRLLLPSGGFLHTKALGWFAFAAARHPERAIFTDEELGDIDRQGRFIPRAVHLAAAADLDALLEDDVAGTILLLPPAAAALSLSPADTGALLALRLDLTRDGRLTHLPLPLGRRLTRQAPPGATELEHRRQIAEGWLHGFRAGASIEPASPLASARVRWGAPSEAIGVVVPSRDNPEDLERFVVSLVETARRPEALHFLLIDHRGTRPETAACFARLAGRRNVDVLRIDEPFNWARFNNLGAAALAGRAQSLIFANDDLEMFSQGWDDILSDALERPGVGAVGARLIYPDDLIQHAGVVAGWGEAVNNDGRLRHISEPGPNQRWRVTRSAAALIGAFLAVRTENFKKVGGFDEADLPIAFSDVDLCFKLRALGMRSLYSPHLTLRHHESKTRGDDAADADRQARYRCEQAVMERRWGDALRRDPSVHPFWRDLGVPFQLLSLCGADEVIRHLDLCASREPWRLDPPLTA